MVDLDTELAKLLNEFQIPAKDAPEPVESSADIPASPEPVASEPDPVAPEPEDVALPDDVAESAIAAALVEPEEPEEEEWPEPITFQVTVGADVRAYCNFEQEALTLEEARQKALARVQEGDFFPERNPGAWRIEMLQGEESICAFPDGEWTDEFWSPPAPVGAPRYSDLESFARKVSRMTLPEDEFAEMVAGGKNLNGYADADEYAADVSDDRLMDEWWALRKLIAESRAMLGGSPPAPQPAQEAQEAPAAPVATEAPSFPVPAAAGALASTLAVLAVTEEPDEQRALAQIRQARAAFLAMYCALKAFDRDFGDVIENDEEMPGADTVDRVVNLWHAVKGAIAMAEARA